MTHLLLGLDPKYIRESPYTPVANYIPPVRAVELGLEVGEHVHLYTFPSVASYVGGDIVSGVLGSGIYQRKPLTLYIDIGTNGEIVIGNSEWMVTAACSAGPAFEGGGIKHGMRATTGALEDFRIDPVSYEPMLLTIGMVKPKGICGSGLDQHGGRIPGGRGDHAQREIQRRPAHPRASGRARTGWSTSWPTREKRPRGRTWSSPKWTSTT